MLLRKNAIFISKSVTHSEHLTQGMTSKVGKLTLVTSQMCLTVTKTSQNFLPKKGTLVAKIALKKYNNDCFNAEWHYGAGKIVLLGRHYA